MDKHVLPWQLERILLRRSQCFWDAQVISHMVGEQGVCRSLVPVCFVSCSFIAAF